MRRFLAWRGLDEWRAEGCTIERGAASAISCSRAMMFVVSIVATIVLNVLFRR